MATDGAWNDDDVSEYMTQLIRESRGDRFAQYVDKRLPELLKEYQTQNQIDQTDNDDESKRPIPKPKNVPSTDDGKPARKRGGYWGSNIDEDEEL
jgi:hypothetical protein